MKHLVIALILLPLIATAKPGAASRYLIDEPPSMMDLGIWKLSESLSADRYAIGSQFEKAARFELSSLVARARYEFEADQIIVLISAVAKDESPLKVTYGGLETGCTETIKHVASSIDTEQLYEYFTHSGYNFGNQPENMGESLAQITRLQCNASDSIGEISVAVERKLLQEEISVTRNSSEESQ